MPLALPSRATLQAWLLAIAVFAVVTACDPRVRYAPTSDPEPGDLWEDKPLPSRCPERGDHRAARLVACAAQAREVRAWGPPPRDAPPIPQCPVGVRVAGGGVVAEPLSFLNAFDPVPWNECVPTEYVVGARRVLRVDDGWLVAYAGMSRGELFWTNDDGTEKKLLSGARVVGFSRAPSGRILALAVGRARLGRGGVLAFERRDRGDYAPRLVASLPLEPSPIAFDDAGRILGFAQGFVFRVDESGNVENVHYIARSVGRVASIAKGADGIYYLGLECGVLRIVPDGCGSGFREEWWSARDGASGRWPACIDG